MKLERVIVRQKEYSRRGVQLNSSEESIKYTSDLLQNAQEPMFLLSVLNTKGYVISTTVLSVNDFLENKQEVLANAVLSGGAAVIAADTYDSDITSEKLCREISELVMAAGARMLDYIQTSKERVLKLPYIEASRKYQFSRPVDMDSKYIINNLYLETEGSLDIKEPTIIHAIGAIAHDFSTRDREHFGVLNLDEYDEPINYSIISVGNIDSAYVGMRESIITPLLSEAKNCIFFHNHPSGDIIKSKEDIDIAEKLKYALSKFGVTVCDNIIIGEDAIYSFAMDAKLNIYHEMEKEEEYSF